MTTARKFLSLSSIVFCMMILVPSVVSAEDVTDISLEVELSSKEVNRGNFLIVNVTSTTNNTTVYSYVTHNDDILTIYTGTTSADGKFTFIYYTNKTMDCGEYMLKVSVANFTTSVSFDVVPTLLEVYTEDQMVRQEIAKFRAENSQFLATVVPLECLIGFAVLVGCYFIFVVPGGTKEDMRTIAGLRNSYTLRRLKSDVRDFTRL